MADIKREHLTRILALKDATDNHPNADWDYPKNPINAKAPYLAIHSDTSQELPAENGWIRVLPGVKSITIYDAYGNIILQRGRSIEESWKKA